MFRQPQRTSTFEPVSALEVAPQMDRLLRETRVGRVEVVAAERPRAAVRRGHRVPDPSALEDDDPRRPLRGVIRREQPHHTAADDHEIVERSGHAVTSSGRSPSPFARSRRSRSRFGEWIMRRSGRFLLWRVISEPIHIICRGDPATGAPEAGEAATVQRAPKCSLRRSGSSYPPRPGVSGEHGCQSPRGQGPHERAAVHGIGAFGDELRRRDVVRAGRTGRLVLLGRTLGAGGDTPPPGRAGLACWRPPTLRPGPPR